LGAVSRCACTSSWKIPFSFCSSKSQKSILVKVLNVYANIFRNTFFSLGTRSNAFFYYESMRSPCVVGSCGKHLVIPAPGVHDFPIGCIKYNYGV
jgi:hypothetical protein